MEKGTEESKRKDEIGKDRRKESQKDINKTRRLKNTIIGRQKIGTGKGIKG